MCLHTWSLEAGQAEREVNGSDASDMGQGDVEHVSKPSHCARLVCTDDARKASVAVSWHVHAISENSESFHKQKKAVARKCDAFRTEW